MRVILDTDPGNGFAGSDIDDGLAIGLLLASPEVTLEAITIVGGNTSIEDGCQAALNLLEIAGSSIPVYAGSRRPILGDAKAWRRELRAFADDSRAIEFWRSIEPAHPSGRIESEHAANAIVRLATKAPGQFTLIAIGPLTNVAKAILLDPELPKKLARVVIMGGSFGVWHHPVELNFGYDPEAAEIVLSSGANVTLVPLDTTLKTSLSLEHNERLKASPNALTRYLGRTCEPWIKWIQHRDRRNGCALHDPLAVAAMIDPTLVTVDMACVDVELAGRLTRGRPVSWKAERRDLLGGMALDDRKPIQVVVGVDGERFVTLLLDRLAGS